MLRDDLHRDASNHRRDAKENVNGPLARRDVLRRRRVTNFRGQVSDNRHPVTLIELAKITSLKYKIFSKLVALWLLANGWYQIELSQILGSDGSHHVNRKIRSET